MLNKYWWSSAQYNFFRVYSKVYKSFIFCKDDTVIVTLRANPKPCQIIDGDGVVYMDVPCTGVVNMRNELIIPFKYYRIFKKGVFFFAIGDGIQLFDIHGNYYGVYSRIVKTQSPIVLKIYDLEHSFRLIFRQRKISHGSFDDQIIVDGCLMWLLSTNGLWGAIKGTNLMIPFKYCAITQPEHTYSFGLIKKEIGSESLYDCELIKVSIKKSKILGQLFTDKKLTELKDVFSCDCYNFKSSIDYQVMKILKDTPPSTLIWRTNEYDLKSILNMPEEEEEYNDAENYNQWEYNDNDLLNDVFDGDKEAMASCFVD